MSRAVALFVALVHCAPGGAQELGRLFFSPAEREALESRRGEKSGHSPAAAPVPARVDGYVLHSSGRPTLWINGRMARPGSEAEAESPREQAALPGVRRDGTAGVRR